jgi:hypothetical protein
MILVSSAVEAAGAEVVEEAVAVAAVAVGAWVAAVAAAWAEAAAVWVVHAQAQACPVRPAAVGHRHSAGLQGRRGLAAASQAVRDHPRALVPVVLVPAAVPSIDHRKV